MHITLAHSADMPAFILFAPADQYSWATWSPWWNAYGAEGVVDLDFLPKPAYDALLDELGAR